MTTLALRLAPPRSRLGAHVAFGVGCAVAGSLLVAGLAQLTIHLPFTPVPITGQTLGVLLIGAAYGPALGGTTLCLYLLYAVIGLPVLAANADGSRDTGWAVLTMSEAGATGGYLLGFVAASALVGWLSRLGWDRSFRSSVSAMFLGEIVIYLVGIPWLMAALDVGAQKALTLGFYPFVIGDTIKLLAAAALLPGAWWAIGRLRPEEE
jgi:biotin transport system substrate-specific component